MKEIREKISKAIKSNSSSTEWDYNVTSKCSTCGEEHQAAWNATLLTKINEIDKDKISDCIIVSPEVGVIFSELFGFNGKNGVDVKLLDLGFTSIGDIFQREVLIDNYLPINIIIVGNKTEIFDIPESKIIGKVTILNYSLK